MQIVSCSWLCLAVLQEAAGVLQNVFGVAFTVSAALFLLRVLNKRASRAVTIKLARDRAVRRSLAPSACPVPASLNSRVSATARPTRSDVGRARDTHKLSRRGLGLKVKMILGLFSLALPDGQITAQNPACRGWHCCCRDFIGLVEPHGIR